MVFVGQGTYGCVYRPPIKCKNGIKYKKGKVSKLMIDKEAKKEVKEYDILKNVDPQKLYYTGPPIECKADPVDAIIEITNRADCNLLRINPNIDDYSLLIYNDGGFDLDKFFVTEIDNYVANDRQKQTDLFFLNAYNLLKGVKLFIEKDFIHHDIKPGNIVFEPSKHRFNFIDFGLSRNYSVFFNGLINGSRTEPFHWSYPLEFGFLNSAKPHYIGNMTNQKLDVIFSEISNIILHPTNRENKYGIRGASYAHTFGYMENMLSKMTNLKKETMIFSAINGIRSLMNDDIGFVTEKSVKYSDIYSLGFTLNHALNSFYKRNLITDADYYMFHKLFSTMFEFDLNLREHNIDRILMNYKSILQYTGILSRLGKQIVNNIIIDAIPSLNQGLANPLDKICPPEKELNPLTNRCINKCSPNTVRNNKGRCVKATSPKISLSSKKSSSVINLISAPKTRKLCPPGKELNQLTNRCINKCSPNTVRNNKGRCVKR